MCAAQSVAQSEERTFVNPLWPGADPWVVRHEGHYYFCETAGGVGVAVWKSTRLTERGEKRIVWRAPATGWNARQVWAPELHFINGRWYIYYAASDGDNANHRMGVLESASANPQGDYTDKGVLYTGDDESGGLPNRWAIDATVLTLDDRHGSRAQAGDPAMLLLWSGWPAEKDVQYLYIAPLANPWTIGGRRVRICDNSTHVWERVGEDPAERGLNEAPQVLRHDGRVFVVYSCSGSWQPTYKLGLLELRPGGDPLDANNWRKQDQPVFQSTESVFGVGHPCFVKSPDDREDWIVYHAKTARTPGWDRVVCMQPFGWSPDGFPQFGRPVPHGQPLPLPSGEK
jgi:GH43 family beta-xylosidase